MKFYSTISFEKHLESSFPDQLSHLFLLASTCPYEKELWIKLIASYFKKKQPQLDLFSFQADSLSIKSVLDEIQTPSLWSKLKIIVMHDIDQIKPAFSYNLLKPYIFDKIILILCSSSSKGLDLLYQQEKKEMLVLNTIEEKPWEKEKRLQEWVMKEARKSGKNIGFDTASFFMKILGTDIAILDQELKKVIAYVGDFPSIEIDDIKAICSSKDLTTSWLLAECVVWQKPVVLKDRAKDLSFLLPFIGQIRYQLQLGAKLAELVENHSSLSQIKSYFPSMRPAQVDKLTSLSSKRKKLFFLNGLRYLYQLEVVLKTSSLCPKSCFDYFQGKVYQNIQLDP